MKARIHSRSRQRRIFSAKFKSDIVIELLKCEKDINTLATENNIQPNLLRNWKKEFLSNASACFLSTTFPSVQIGVTEVSEAAGQVTVFTVPVVLPFYKDKEYHREARIIDFYMLKKRMLEFRKQNRLFL